MKLILWGLVIYLAYVWYVRSGTAAASSSAAAGSIPLASGQPVDPNLSFGSDSVITGYTPGTYDAAWARSVLALTPAQTIAATKGTDPNSLANAQEVAFNMLAEDVPFETAVLEENQNAASAAAGASFWNNGSFSGLSSFGKFFGGA